MTGEPTFKLPPDGKNPYCFFVFSNFSFFFTGVLGGVYNTGKHSFYPLYSLSPLHGLTQGGGWRKGEGGGREGGRETHNSCSDGTYLLDDYTIYIQ